MDLSGSQLKRWVINLSKKQLTPVETSVLAKGLNYAVVLDKPPVEQLIIAVEKACLKITEGERTQVRAKITSTIKSTPMPKCNLSKEQSAAIKDLSKDDNILILPADKGKTVVVMDRQDYITKVNTTLSDQKTYQKLTSDPTGTYKRKLVAMLKSLLAQKKITQSQKDYLYPTEEGIPRMYCTPKIHKKDCPLRPIVDYTGSISYNLSRSLADILKPLVGKTKYHLENSKDLIKCLKSETVSADETLVSYDVVALFTSTPVDQSLRIVRERLSKDKTLKKRTLLSVDDIVKLLNFVLSTTYFVF